MIEGGGGEEDRKCLIEGEEDGNCRHRRRVWKMTAAKRERGERREEGCNEQDARRG